MAWSGKKARVIIAKSSIIPILLLGTSCATLQFCSTAPVISFGLKRLKGIETLSNGQEQSVSDINSNSLAKTITLLFKSRIFTALMRRWIKVGPEKGRLPIWEKRSQRHPRFRLKKWYPHTAVHCDTDSPSGLLDVQIVLEYSRCFTHQ